MISNTWFGIEIARRGLTANRRALDVIGRNVANVGNRHYSRQEISFSATLPVNAPAGSGVGQLGTGVEAAFVARHRDDFLDRQYRHWSANHGQHEAWLSTMEQVESIISEPGEDGMQAYLERFWMALQELAKQPDASETRVQVREVARSLVSVIRETHATLVEIAENVNQAIRTRVAEVNTLATELAGLNGQILQATVRGQLPNDLKDKRDAILDSLTRIAGATWREQENGLYSVYLGTQVLVMGVTVRGIEVTEAAAGPELTWANGGDQAVRLVAGEVAGYLAVRSGPLPRQVDYLETLAATLAREMNAQHAQGYRPLQDGETPGLDNVGGEFFTVTYRDPLGNTRAIINTLGVANDLRLFAAAEHAEAPPMDGRNAQKMADLLEEPLVNHDLTNGLPASLTDFWRAVVGEIGVVVRRGRSNFDTSELQLRQADTQRQSVVGVSLDEEMTRLIQHQNAYAAAARVVNAMDEVLDVIINRMGLVGR